MTRVENGHPAHVPGRDGRRRRRRAEQLMVPDVEFTSYYGRPVIKEPAWGTPDIAGYLFLGGLAGASSMLAAGAEVSGYGELARVAKVGALGAISLSAVALVHDLGRPERFANMLRVFKPTSPMSVGSWLLSAYGPVAGVAAVSDVTGILPAAGTAATLGAGLFGPAVATYTAALICDTSVPGWHEGYREMPYLFAGSASCAAAGLGLLTLPPAAAAPARTLATLGAPAELVAKRLLLRRLGDIAEPYETGRPGQLLRAAELLTVGGLVGAVLGRRSRAVSALAGASLLAASALTRFGVFEAGMATARDPKYTVIPQRRRRDRRRGMNERPPLLYAAVAYRVMFPGSVNMTSSIFPSGLPLYHNGPSAQVAHVRFSARRRASRSFSMRGFAVSPERKTTL